MNAQQVSKVLRAKGQKMVLKKASGGIFDPVTGASSGEAVVSADIYGITTNYNSIDKLAIKFKDGSAIVAGDKQALVESTGPVPDAGDKLEVMGHDWVILGVDDSSPQGEVVLYKLQLRK
jgi:hypothetical protein